MALWIQYPRILKGRHMAPEIERRFLVWKLDPCALRTAEWHEIEQGYLLHPRNSQLRIRIVDEKIAFLTSKRGQGICREEKTLPLQLSVARLLFAHCKLALQKTRFLKDGWELDIFHGALDHVILLERELKRQDEELSLPCWIFEAVEVTQNLANISLARLARNLGKEQNEAKRKEALERFLSQFKPA